MKQNTQMFRNVNLSPSSGNNVKMSETKLHDTGRPKRSCTFHNHLAFNRLLFGRLSRHYRETYKARIKILLQTLFRTETLKSLVARLTEVLHGVKLEHKLKRLVRIWRGNYISSYPTLRRHLQNTLTM